MKTDQDDIDGFDIGTSGPSLGDRWEAVKADIDAREQLESTSRNVSDGVLLALIAIMYLAMTYLETSCPSLN